MARFPNLRAPLRAVGGRRVTAQVVGKKVVDRVVQVTGLELRRVGGTMAPMPAHKIAIKQEGQRSWKWWQLYSPARLELNWILQLDGDVKANRRFEVMEEEDWGQARIFVYQLAESPR